MFNSTNTRKEHSPSSESPIPQGVYALGADAANQQLEGAAQHQPQQQFRRPFASVPELADDEPGDNCTSWQPFGAAEHSDCLDGREDFADFPRDPPEDLMDLEPESVNHKVSSQVCKSSTLRFERSLGSDGEFTDLNGEYILYNTRVLGRGSFGEVKLCYCKEDGSFYALKILNKKQLEKLRMGLGGGDNLIDKVMEEIAIMKRIRHENVIALKEVVEDGINDRIYLILELAEYGTLFAMNNGFVEEDEDGRIQIPENAVKELTISLVEALTHAHEEAHVAHRDIKPENILLNNDNQVKLSDFGVGCFVAHHQKESLVREGSIAFLPPEMLLPITDQMVVAAPPPTPGFNLAQSGMWMDGSSYAFSPLGDHQYNSGNPATFMNSASASNVHCGQWGDTTNPQVSELPPPFSLNNSNTEEKSHNSNTLAATHQVDNGDDAAHQVGSGLQSTTHSGTTPGCVSSDILSPIRNMPMSNEEGLAQPQPSNETGTDQYPASRRFDRRDSEAPDLESVNPPLNMSFGGGMGSFYRDFSTGTPATLRPKRSQHRLDKNRQPACNSPPPTAATPSGPHPHNRQTNDEGEFNASSDGFNSDELAATNLGGGELGNAYLSTSNNAKLDDDDDDDNLYVNHLQSNTTEGSMHQFLGRKRSHLNQSSPSEHSPPSASPSPRRPGTNRRGNTVVVKEDGCIPHCPPNLSSPSGSHGVEAVMNMGLPPRAPSFHAKSAYEVEGSLRRPSFGAMATSLSGGFDPDERGSLDEEHSNSTPKASSSSSSLQQVIEQEGGEIFSYVSGSRVPLSQLRSASQQRMLSTSFCGSPIARGPSVAGATMSPIGQHLDTASPPTLRGAGDLHRHSVSYRQLNDDEPMHHRNESMGGSSRTISNTFPTSNPNVARPPLAPTFGSLRSEGRLPVDDGEASALTQFKRFQSVLEDHSTAPTFTAQNPTTNSSSNVHELASDPHLIPLTNKTSGPTNVSFTDESHYSGPQRFGGGGVAAASSPTGFGPQQHLQQIAPPLASLPVGDSDFASSMMMSPNANPIGWRTINRNEVDLFKADVWALGVTVFVMLHGHLPWVAHVGLPPKTHRSTQDRLRLLQRLKTIITSTATSSQQEAPSPVGDLLKPTPSTHCGSSTVSSGLEIGEIVSTAPRFMIDSVYKACAVPAWLQDASDAEDANDQTASDRIACKKQCERSDGLNNSSSSSLVDGENVVTTRLDPHSRHRLKMYRKWRHRKLKVERQNNRLRKEIKFVLNAFDAFNEGCKASRAKHTGSGTAAAASQAGESGDFSRQHSKQLSLSPTDPTGSPSNALPKDWRFPSSSAGEYSTPKFGNTGTSSTTINIHHPRSLPSPLVAPHSPVAEESADEEGNEVLLRQGSAFITIPAASISDRNEALVTGHIASMTSAPAAAHHGLNRKGSSSMSGGASSPMASRMSTTDFKFLKGGANLVGSNSPLGLALAGAAAVFATPTSTQPASSPNLEKFPSLSQFPKRESIASSNTIGKVPAFGYSAFGSGTSALTAPTPLEQHLINAALYHRQHRQWRTNAASSPLSSEKKTSESEPHDGSYSTQNSGITAGAPISIIPILTKKNSSAPSLFHATSPRILQALRTEERDDRRNIERATWEYWTTLVRKSGLIIEDCPDEQPLEVTSSSPSERHQRRESRFRAGQPPPVKPSRLDCRAPEEKQLLAILTNPDPVRMLHSHMIEGQPLHREDGEFTEEMARVTLEQMDLSMPAATSSLSRQNTQHVTTAFHTDEFEKDFYHGGGEGSGKLKDDDCQDFSEHRLPILKQHLENQSSETSRVDLGKSAENLAAASDTPDSSHKGPMSTPIRSFARETSGLQLQRSTFCLGNGSFHVAPPTNDRKQSPDTTPLCPPVDNASITGTLFGYGAGSAHLGSLAGASMPDINSSFADNASFAFGSFSAVVGFLPRMGRRNASTTGSGSPSLHPTALSGDSRHKNSLEPGSDVAPGFTESCLTPLSPLAKRCDTDMLDGTGGTAYSQSTDGPAAKEPVNAPGGRGKVKAVVIKRKDGLRTRRVCRRSPEEIKSRLLAFQTRHLEKVAASSTTTGPPLLGSLVQRLGKRGIPASLDERDLINQSKAKRATPDSQPTSATSNPHLPLLSVAAHQPGSTSWDVGRAMDSEGTPTAKSTLRSDLPLAPATRRLRAFSELSHHSDVGPALTSRTDSEITPTYTSKRDPNSASQAAAHSSQAAAKLQKSGSDATQNAAPHPSLWKSSLVASPLFVEDLSKSQDPATLTATRRNTDATRRTGSSPGPSDFNTGSFIRPSTSNDSPHLEAHPVNVSHTSKAGSVRVLNQDANTSATFDGLANANSSSSHRRRSDITTPTVAVDAAAMSLSFNRVNSNVHLHPAGSGPEGGDATLVELDPALLNLEDEDVLEELNDAVFCSTSDSQHSFLSSADSEPDFYMADVKGHGVTEWRCAALNDLGVGSDVGIGSIIRSSLSGHHSTMTATTNAEACGESSRRFTLFDGESGHGSSTSRASPRHTPSHGRYPPSSPTWGVGVGGSVVSQTTPSRRCRLYYEHFQLADCLITQRCDDSEVIALQSRLKEAVSVAVGFVTVNSAVTPHRGGTLSAPSNPSSPFGNLYASRTCSERLPTTESQPTRRPRILRRRGSGGTSSDPHEVEEAQELHHSTTSKEELPGFSSLKKIISGHSDYVPSCRFGNPTSPSNNPLSLEGLPSLPSTTHDTASSVHSGQRQPSSIDFASESAWATRHQKLSGASLAKVPATSASVERRSSSASSNEMAAQGPTLTLAPSFSMLDYIDPSTFKGSLNLPDFGGEAALLFGASSTGENWAQPNRDSLVKLVRKSLLHYVDERLEISTDTPPKKTTLVECVPPSVATLFGIFVEALVNKVTAMESSPRERTTKGVPLPKPQPTLDATLPMSTRPRSPQPTSHSSPSSLQTSRRTSRDAVSVDVFGGFETPPVTPAGVVGPSPTMRTMTSAQSFESISNMYPYSRSPYVRPSTELVGETVEGVASETPVLMSNSLMLENSLVMATTSDNPKLQTKKIKDVFESVFSSEPSATSRLETTSDAFVIGRSALVATLYHMLRSEKIELSLDDFDSSVATAGPSMSALVTQVSTSALNESARDDLLHEWSTLSYNAMLSIIHGSINAIADSLMKRFSASGTHCSATLTPEAATRLVSGTWTVGNNSPVVDEDQPRSDGIGNAQSTAPPAMPSFAPFAYATAHPNRDGANNQSNVNSGSHVTTDRKSSTSIDASGTGIASPTNQLRTLFQSNAHLAKKLVAIQGLFDRATVTSTIDEFRKHKDHRRKRRAHLFVKQRRYVDTLSRRCGPVFNRAVHMAKMNDQYGLFASVSKVAGDTADIKLMEEPDSGYADPSQWNTKVEDDAEDDAAFYATDRFKKSCPMSPFRECSACCSVEAIAFMRATLRLDPATRPCMKELLEHPWLTDLYRERCEERRVEAEKAASAAAASIAAITPLNNLTMGSPVAMGLLETPTHDAQEETLKPSRYTPATTPEATPNGWDVSQKLSNENSVSLSLGLVESSVLAERAAASITTPTSRTPLELDSTTKAPVITAKSTAGLRITTTSSPKSLPKEQRPRRARITFAEFIERTKTNKVSRRSKLGIEGEGKNPLVASEGLHGFVKPPKRLDATDVADSILTNRGTAGLGYSAVGDGMDPEAIFGSLTRLSKSRRQRSSSRFGTSGEEEAATAGSPLQSMLRRNRSMSKISSQEAAVASPPLSRPHKLSNTSQQVPNPSSNGPPSASRRTPKEATSRRQSSGKLGTYTSFLTPAPGSAAARRQPQRSDSGTDPTSTGNQPESPTFSQVPSVADFDGVNTIPTDNNSSQVLQSSFRLNRQDPRMMAWNVSVINALHHSGVVQPPDQAETPVSMRDPSPSLEASASALMMSPRRGSSSFWKLTTSCDSSPHPSHAASPKLVSRGSFNKRSPPITSVAMRLNLQDHNDEDHNPGVPNNSFASVPEHASDGSSPFRRQHLHVSPLRQAKQATDGAVRRVVSFNPDVDFHAHSSSSRDMADVHTQMAPQQHRDPNNVLPATSTLRRKRQGGGEKLGFAAPPTVDLTAVNLSLVQLRLLHQLEETVGNWTDDDVASSRATSNLSKTPEDAYTSRVSGLGFGDHNSPTTSAFQPTQVESPVAQGGAFSVCGSPSYQTPQHSTRASGLVFFDSSDASSSKPTKNANITNAKSPSSLLNFFRRIINPASAKTPASQSSSMVDDCAGRVSSLSHRNVAPLAVAGEVSDAKAYSQRTLSGISNFIGARPVESDEPSVVSKSASARFFMSASDSTIGIATSLFPPGTAENNHNADTPTMPHTPTGVGSTDVCLPKPYKATMTGMGKILSVNDLFDIDSTDVVSNVNSPHIPQPAGAAMHHNCLSLPESPSDISAAPPRPTSPTAQPPATLERAFPVSVEDMSNVVSPRSADEEMDATLESSQHAEASYEESASTSTEEDDDDIKVTVGQEIAYNALLCAREFGLTHSQIAASMARHPSEQQPHDTEHQFPLRPDQMFDPAIRRAYSLMNFRGMLIGSFSAALSRWEPIEYSDSSAEEDEEDETHHASTANPSGNTTPSATRTSSLAVSNTSGGLGKKTSAWSPVTERISNFTPMTMLDDRVAYSKRSSVNDLECLSTSNRTPTSDGAHNNFPIARVSTLAEIPASSQSTSQADARTNPRTAINSMATTASTSSLLTSDVITRQRARSTIAGPPQLPKIGSGQGLSSILSPNVMSPKSRGSGSPHDTFRETSINNEILGSSILIPTPMMGRTNSGSQPQQSPPGRRGNRPRLGRVSSVEDTLSGSPLSPLRGVGGNTTDSPLSGLLSPSQLPLDDELRSPFNSNSANNHQLDVFADKVAAAASQNQLSSSSQGGVLLFPSPMRSRRTQHGTLHTTNPTSLQSSPACHHLSPKKKSSNMTSAPTSPSNDSPLKAISPKSTSSAGMLPSVSSASNNRPLLVISHNHTISESPMWRDLELSPQSQSILALSRNTPEPHALIAGSLRGVASENISSSTPVESKTSSANPAAAQDEPSHTEAAHINSRNPLESSVSGEPHNTKTNSTNDSTSNSRKVSPGSESQEANSRKVTPPASRVSPFLGPARRRSSSIHRLSNAMLGSVSPSMQSTQTESPSVHAMTPGPRPLEPAHPTPLMSNNASFGRGVSVTLDGSVDRDPWAGFEGPTLQISRSRRGSMVNMGRHSSRTPLTEHAASFSGEASSGVVDSVGTTTPGIFASPLPEVSSASINNIQEVDSNAQSSNTHQHILSPAVIVHRPVVEEAAASAATVHQSPLMTMDDLEQGETVIQFCWRPEYGNRFVLNPWILWSISPNRRRQLSPRQIGGASLLAKYPRAPHLTTTAMARGATACSEARQDSTKPSEQRISAIFAFSSDPLVSPPKPTMATRVRERSVVSFANDPAAHTDGSHSSAALPPPIYEGGATHKSATSEAPSKRTLSSTIRYLDEHRSEVPNVGAVSGTSLDELDTADSSRQGDLLPRHHLRSNVMGPLPPSRAHRNSFSESEGSTSSPQPSWCRKDKDGYDTMVVSASVSSSVSPSLAFAPDGLSTVSPMLQPQQIPLMEAAGEHSSSSPEAPQSEPTTTERSISTITASMSPSRPSVSTLGRPSRLRVSNSVLSMLSEEELVTHSPHDSPNLYYSSANTSLRASINNNHNAALVSTRSTPQLPLSSSSVNRPNFAGEDPGESHVQTAFASVVTFTARGSFAGATTTADASSSAMAASAQDMSSLLRFSVAASGSQNSAAPGSPHPTLSAETSAFGSVASSPAPTPGRYATATAPVPHATLQSTTTLSTGLRMGFGGGAAPLPSHPSMGTLCVSPASSHQFTPSSTPQTTPSQGPTTASTSPFIVPTRQLTGSSPGPQRVNGESGMRSPSNFHILPPSDIPLSNNRLRTSPRNPDDNDDDD